MFQPMDTELGSLWELLTDGVVEQIASFLPDNDVACDLRLLNKATARQLRRWTRVRLSQPVPQHAFAHRWTPERSTSGLTLEQRQHLLCLVAGSGSLPNLQVALAAADCGRVPEDVFIAAAVGGHIHIIEWLRQQGHRCPSCYIAENAARAGQRAVVHWVLAQEEDPRVRGDQAIEMCRQAAACGHRALCEELLSSLPQLPKGGILVVKYMLETSLGAGHTDLVQWLLAKFDIRDVNHGSLLAYASYGLDLPALRQLYDTILPQGLSRSSSSNSRTADQVQKYQSDIAAAALCSPHPDWREKLEWLEGAVGAQPLRSSSVFVRVGVVASAGKIVQRPDAVERILYLGADTRAGRGTFSALKLLRAAVTSGNLAVVQYLLSPEDEGGAVPRTGELTVELTELAASLGHLSILKVLLAAGCPMQSRAVEEAALNGKLHVLQWLAGPEAGQSGVAAFRAATSSPRLLLCDAALSGSLALVRWLREELRCPWDEGSFTAGSESGNVELVEWLAKEGCCPMPATGAPYLAAGRNDDLATLRCLRRLGCPWGDPPGCTFAEAVWSPAEYGGCSLPVLQWLVAEGCPVDLGEARRRVASRSRLWDKDYQLVSDWVVAMAAESQQQQC